MRYQVHGVSRTTGDEARMTVEAESHAAAEAIAQRSMLVAEIELESAQADDTDALAAAAQSARSAGPSIGGSRLKDIRKRRWFICPNPNCGHRGPAIRQPKGSFLVALVLTVLVLPLGLIYWLFAAGYVYRCPRCGMELGRKLS